MHYCCVGDSLCAPSPIPVAGCICGFVSDSNAEKTTIPLNQVYISELLPEVSPAPKTITVSSSTKSKINGKTYQIKNRKYSVNEKGIVIFELEEV